MDRKFELIARRLPNVIAQATPKLTKHINDSLDIKRQEKHNFVLMNNSLNLREFFESQMKDSPKINENLSLSRRRRDLCSFELFSNDFKRISVNACCTCVPMSSFLFFFSEAH